jgi:hypothetical protein
MSNGDVPLGSGEVGGVSPGPRGGSGPLAGGTTAAVKGRRVASGPDGAASEASGALGSTLAAGVVAAGVSFGSDVVSGARVGRGFAVAFGGSLVGVAAGLGVGLAVGLGVGFGFGVGLAVGFGVTGTLIVSAAGAVPARTTHGSAAVRRAANSYVQVPAVPIVRCPEYVAVVVPVAVDGWPGASASVGDTSPAIVTRTVWGGEQDAFQEASTAKLMTVCGVPLPGAASPPASASLQFPAAVAALGPRGQPNGSQRAARSRTRPAAGPVRRRRCASSVSNGPRTPAVLAAP